jgi:hypothetical protein
MAGKKTAPGKAVEMRLTLPGEVKEMLAKFRAKRVLADKPITSDSDALLTLAKEGYKSLKV